MFSCKFVHEFMCRLVVGESEREGEVVIDARVRRVGCRPAYSSSYRKEVQTNDGK